MEQSKLIKMYFLKFWLNVCDFSGSFTVWNAQFTSVMKQKKIKICNSTLNFRGLFLGIEIPRHSTAVWEFGVWSCLDWLDYERWRLSLPATVIKA